MKKVLLALLIAAVTFAIPMCVINDCGEPSDIGLQEININL